MEPNPQAPERPNRLEAEPAVDPLDHYTDGRPCWCMPHVEDCNGVSIVIHKTAEELS